MAGRRPPFPNSVFMLCLHEMETVAREKGWKSAYAYHKGLVSLQRYPLPLPTPKAALDLEGIGTHLVEKFEKYMANFLKEHGPSWADAEAAADALWQATFDKKGKAKKTSPSVAAASAAGTGSSAPSQSITPSPSLSVPLEPRIRAHASSNDASSQSSDGGGAGAGAAATADTAYRPRARSGAYAIMIALRRAAVQPGYPGYCTKEQLLREAQPFCESSLLVPEAGTRYTGWSSMTTLIEKQLVRKWSSPAKFCLTEAGRQVAEQLDVVLPAGVGVTVPKTLSSTSTFQPTAPASSLAAPAGSTYGTSARPEPFYYWFLDSAGARTRFRDSAAVNFDKASQSVGYRIEFLARQRTHEVAQRVFEAMPWPAAEGTATLTWAGYLPADDADALCMEWRESVPAAASAGRPPLVPVAPATASSFPDRPSTAAASSADRPPLSRTGSLASGTTSVAGVKRTTSFSGPLKSGSDAESDTDDDGTGNTTQAIDPAAMARWTAACTTTRWPPGSFELVLVLDNREVREKRDRQYIQDGLEANGVTIETRALPVGDVLWLLRRRGQPASDDDLVAGSVIERKRMDDLLASMKDGRLREQRFRLSMCGADHVTYLVEDMGGPAMEQLADRERMNTAMWHLQVFAGFFLKRTGSTDQSIQYLTRMTRALEETVLHREAVGISRLPETGMNARAVKELRQALALPDGRLPLVSYRIFGQINQKSRTQTVHDLFVKQLLQLKNVGVEKAAAIVQRYPTLSHLVAAYAEVPTEDERRFLLADLTYGARSKKRRIGAIASGTVYDVLWAPSYDSPFGV